MADRWIRSRFGQMLEQFENALTEYRFDFAATALYEFTWYEFCDWYLELTKPVMQSETSSEAAKRGTRQTLAEMLEALQRALHPADAVHHGRDLAARRAPRRPEGRDGDAAALPEVAASSRRTPEAEREIEWIRNFILGVRQIRSGMDIAPSRKLPVLLQNASADDLARVNQHRAYLDRLAGLESITALGGGRVGASVGHRAGGRADDSRADGRDSSMRMRRSIASTKKIEKTRADRDKIAKKLSNENFVKNAPPDVVALDRGRIEEFDRTLASLEAQLARVRSLKGGQ